VLHSVSVVSLAQTMGCNEIPFLFISSQNIQIELVGRMEQNKLYAGGKLKF